MLNHHPQKDYYLNKCCSVHLSVRARTCVHVCIHTFVYLKFYILSLVLCFE